MTLPQTERAYWLLHALPNTCCFPSFHLSHSGGCAAELPWGLNSKFPQTVGKLITLTSGYWPWGCPLCEEQGLVFWVPVNHSHKTAAHQTPHGTFILMPWGCRPTAGGPCWAGLLCAGGLSGCPGWVHSGAPVRAVPPGGAVLSAMAEEQAP